LGRVERLQRSLAKAKRLQQLAEEHKWSMQELHAANDLIGEPTPYGLHASMFLVSGLDPRQKSNCPANHFDQYLGDPPRTRHSRAA
jgi:hypothetical protein